ncbi:hypothetical protein JY651_43970 [Pyxidicoccus parkwayensis]|uniref:SCP domain-containing protein n=1 Tax=Pyxidicoccus parkwayensis TaxID=2813578 RepID=A0ABX7NT44_9BACT|nr:CAP domain-containing protein [Pyxidicoccus parkwaysis]QSQ22032.1 hypothetical protein JY651_43970 [Pyxidicoccus parkwaysis]
MSRTSFRHLLAVGLLAPWLATGCDSEEKPDSEDPSTLDGGTRQDGGTTPDAGTGSDAGTSTDAGTLTQFARDMVDAHNAVRAAAKNPTPSPALEPLTWDTQAEDTAKAWAANCNFSHNSNRGTLGENIAAATPNYWDTAGVVNDWAAEAADYNYANNSCTQGEQCGHYTQVVWRNTKRVGCATQVCTKNSPFGAQFPTWQFWVCNYAPPGNYSGQRPY